MWKPKQVWGCFADPWYSRLQGSDEIRHEARRVVVAPIQRQPGDAQSTIGDPFAEQGGLAKAGRGREEDQPAGQAPVEPAPAPANAQEEAA